MSDRPMLASWRRHNGRLGISSFTSIVIALALYSFAPTPDGRDPVYVAPAIEFVAWGLINLGFTISGIRGANRVTSDELAIAKGRELARLLRINAWLNVVWISLGVVLIAWGYRAWSPSLVGHGVGVLVQAIVLTILDRVFERELHAEPA